MLLLSFKPFPILQTERLILRELKRTDSSNIFYLRSSKRILRYLYRLPEKSESTAGEFIMKIKKNTREGSAIMWGICKQGKDKVIGTICIWNIEPENHRGEVGFVLHPRYQGKGYMKEALTRVLEFAFVQNEFNTISGYVAPDNTASTKLLASSGFKREAHLRESVYFDGKYSDMYIYGIRKKDFRKE